MKLEFNLKPGPFTTFQPDAFDDMVSSRREVDIAVQGNNMKARVLEANVLPDGRRATITLDVPRLQARIGDLVQFAVTEREEEWLA